MIRKRGNKYYYTISVVDSQGVKHRIERVGGSTKAECKLAEAKALASFHDSDNPIVFKTVSQYLDEWYESYVMTLAENTQRNYRSTIRHHVVPAIGGMDISEVKPIHIQKLISSKSELSKSTISNILRMLHGAFRYAVTPCGYIGVNPCEGVRIPKNAKPAERSTVFGSDELSMIFERFNVDHDYHVPLMIMYHTGLRIGEALALHWTDIDMDSNILHVSKTMLESGVIQEKTKTDSSKRDVSFSSKLHDILMIAKEHQQEWKKLTRRTYRMVCCRQDSSRMSTADMRYFNQWCKDNLGHGSCHSFRHTHATMLLERGEAIEIVSKRLGHSSIAITAKVYSHILDRRNKRLVNLLNDF